MCKMKMWQILAGGVVLVGGYLLYRKMYGPQMGSVVYGPYSTPRPTTINSQFGNQPSAQYPVQPVVGPRVDYVSQPWYGGSRSFNTSSADSNVDVNVQNIGNVASVVGSAKSIWDDLGIGSMFDDGGSSFEDSSSESDFDWSSMYN
jgi:hypothetical protein